jgi:hypothetical protein
MRRVTALVLLGLVALSTARQANADDLVIATDRKWPPPPPPPPPPPAPPPSPPSGYVPVSPFQDDLPCAVIPYPRCGPYPFIAFGVQGGAAEARVGWERVVRPYAEAGVMGSVSGWIDFGSSLSIAYDDLEATGGYSFETKLRLRMWMPVGFFADVFAGPMFEHYSFPGTETGARVGGVLGALFSFSDLIGLEAHNAIASGVGPQSDDIEFRYMLGVRFSLTTVVIAGGAIGRAIFK